LFYRVVNAVPKFVSRIAEIYLSSGTFSPCSFWNPKTLGWDLGRNTAPMHLLEGQVV
jgi:hypothetical protein